MLLFGIFLSDPWLYWGLPCRMVYKPGFFSTHCFNLIVWLLTFRPSLADLEQYRILGKKIWVIIFSTTNNNSIHTDQSQHWNQLLNIAQVLFVLLKQLWSETGPLGVLWCLLPGCYQPFFGFCGFCSEASVDWICSSASRGYVIELGCGEFEAK